MCCPCSSCKDHQVVQSGDPDTGPPTDQHMLPNIKCQLSSLWNVMCEPRQCGLRQTAGSDLPVYFPTQTLSLPPSSLFIHSFINGPLLIIHRALQSGSRSVLLFHSRNWTCTETTTTRQTGLNLPPACNVSAAVDFSHTEGNNKLTKQHANCWVQIIPNSFQRTCK